MVVAVLALLFAVLWGALDITVHGHFSDKTICGLVVKELSKRDHLKDWLARYDEDGKLVVDSEGKPVARLDTLGNKESGQVQLSCEGRSVTLEGKVWNEQIRREMSSVAETVPGVAAVDNRLEALNVPELEALQKLLQEQGVTMNYQVVDRGTIMLTGDLPKPEMKDTITNLVQKIRGVRAVVNDLGKEQKVALMLRIHNIYFDFNKWKIRPESQSVLDEVAQKINDYLESHPKGVVRIQGHTDSIASPQYNQWLSEQRAKEVLEALAARGIARESLKSEGKGESKLLVVNDDTPEKRAENRRLEFYFE